MTERQIENRIKKIEELEAQKKAIEEQISSLKAEAKNRCRTPRQWKPHTIQSAGLRLQAKDLIASPLRVSTQSFSASM